MILLIVLLIAVLCHFLKSNSQMKTAENNSIILHENVRIDELKGNVVKCFLLEEPLTFIDVGLSRNHWEIGVRTDSENDFLISTSSQNSIEIFKGQFDGRFFRYGYKNKMDRKTNIVCCSECNPIKLTEVIYSELERIKLHPYKLFYDNCHNNAVYQYLNIIGAKPHKELINIVNKKNGFRLFT